VKYGSGGKCRWKCRRKFCDKRVPSRQTIHKLVDKLRTAGLFLTDRTQKHKSRVLTDEKLNDIGARLEHKHRKSLKRLAQKTWVSKSSARTTEVLKPSSASWCLVCCKCKKDSCTRLLMKRLIAKDIYIHVEVQRFQQLLCSMNRGKNFPSFEIFSACWLCAPQEAALRSPWSAELWTRQVEKKTTLYNAHM
jgi:predicted metal-binding protein